MNDHHASGDDDVMTRVRRALGRTATPASVPEPPELADPVVRLVHSDFGLPELWMKQAAVMKVEASSVGADELAAKVVEYLRAQQLQRIMLPTSPLLEQLGIPEALRSAGFDVGTWEQMTLDQAYDFDCGVTDAAYAVAETGSIVIKPHRGHGRAVSLVPTHHVVILEPANFVPDLVDLFERLGREGLSGSGCVLITGPSKTADIEMNLVEGVHGPRAVRAFVLA